MFLNGSRARLLLCLLAFSTCTPATAIADSSSARSSSYNKTIVWTPCGLNLTIPLLCGTLDVPLDYTATSGNVSTLTLKLAKFPSSQQPSRGSILVNPGGPGYGGRNALIGLGPLIQNTTGGFFDIVSWDPRGTGDTIPVSCFSDAVQRARLSAILPSAVDPSDVSLGQGWAVAEIIASACSKALAETGTLLGTAFVARDMRHIVDALGEDGLLRYWGFSYGTALGMTFAAMFPDKVDRVIIDGVLNPHEYYAGRDVQQATDSDAAYAGFIASCQLSPERCPLVSYAQGKSQSLFEIITQLLKDLKRSPLAFGPDPTTQYVDYGTLKAFIYEALKTPSLLPIISSLLRSILERDGPAVTSSIQLLSTTSPPVFPETILPEQLWAIRCSDSAFRAANLTDLLPLADEFFRRSEFAGDVLVAGQVLPCSRWPFRAKEIYNGGFKNIATRHPIMFIGNTFDPITPLVSARNASAAFNGSQVLAQNGYGHCSVAQSSACTDRHVKQYFLNGTLPAPGTVCQTDTALFAPP